MSVMKQTIDNEMATMAIIIGPFNSIGYIEDLPSTAIT